MDETRTNEVMELEVELVDTNYDVDEDDSESGIGSALVKLGVLTATAAGGYVIGKIRGGRAERKKIAEETEEKVRTIFGYEIRKVKKTKDEPEEEPAEEKEDNKKK